MKVDIPRGKLVIEIDFQGLIGLVVKAMSDRTSFDDEDDDDLDVPVRVNKVNISAWIAR